MKASKQVPLTNCQVQREGQIMTPKESHQARGTHTLSSTEQGMSKNTKRKPVNEVNAHPVEHRGTSQEFKKVGKQRAHTNC